MNTENIQMIDMSKHIKATLEVGSHPDNCHSIPDNIDEHASISPECHEAIIKAEKMLDENPDIRSISIDFEPEISQGDMSMITDNDNVKYDVSYITVYRHGGIYWNLQSKWDCFFQIEYSITLPEG